MATQPVLPSPIAAKRKKPSTRAFSSAVARAGQRKPKPSSRRPDCGSRPSVDLAGRSVALSSKVPAVFDAPLGAHHKLIGRWVATHFDPCQRYTRQEAVRRIEQIFDGEVLAALKPVEIAQLRVAALHGPAGLPPALAIICDSVGQIELGWIEKNPLRCSTLDPAAPVGWRAAAYNALGETLWSVLPIFGYNELVEDMSQFYWDGETTDEGAREALIQWHGADPDDIADIADMLPSTMHARRPDFMFPKKANSLKRLPAGLRQKIVKLREAHKAQRDFGTSHCGAWRYDQEELYAYLPNTYDCSTLLPMTLVPADHFGRELDDIGRQGMEAGFMDTAGLYLLHDPDKLDEWFVALKLGVDVLVAAQDLINSNPNHF